MRSHLVYLAKAQVSNYFLLIHLTAKATRAFHKPKNCIGKTINQALERIANVTTTEECNGMAMDHRALEQRFWTKMGELHQEALERIAAQGERG